MQSLGAVAQTVLKL